jgi:hypothetical protein
VKVNDSLQTVDVTLRTALWRVLERRMIAGFSNGTS